MANTSTDRFLVDADAVLRAAATMCRAMPAQFDSAQAPGAFDRLYAVIGEAVRHLGPHVDRARASLEPDSLLGGHSVDLADGSRVTVDAEGFVRHSVSDAALSVLGLKAAMQAPARDGGTLPLPRSSKVSQARLARHERSRHARGGDRSE